MIHLNITTKQLHVKVPITEFLRFLVLRSYKILKINYRRKKTDYDESSNLCKISKFRMYFCVFIMDLVMKQRQRNDKLINIQYS